MQLLVEDLGEGVKEDEIAQGRRASRAIASYADVLRLVARSSPLSVEQTFAGRNA